MGPNSRAVFFRDQPRDLQSQNADFQEGAKENLSRSAPTALLGGKAGIPLK